MKLKISKINKDFRDINVDGKIVVIESEREVTTSWGKNRVMNAIMEDDTGRIKLVLWGSKIDLVKEGDYVRIMHAYVSTYKDELQLNVPKRGSIEIIREDDLNDGPTEDICDNSSEE